MEDELIPEQIYQALNKPDFMLGAESDLMLLVIASSVALIVLVMSWLAATIGLIYWLIAGTLLRIMAIADPIMSKVYLKHLKYKFYYPPHSSPFRIN